MELRNQITAFAGVVAGVAPDVRVPMCPEWRMRDLVGHIGQGPRWAADILRSGTPTPPPDPRDAEPGPPSGWTGWLLDGTDDLIDAVARAGADTPVWTIVGTRPAGWWLRRMLADLVVHTADAALTAGVPFDVPAARAADAISEGLELLATPGLATFPGDREGDIALRPETGDDWLITRKTAGHTWRLGTADADTTLSGSTQDLLLVLMRRLPLHHVTVTGDVALVEELLTYTV